MPRKPRKMRMNNSAFQAEWNAMVDYLEYVTPAADSRIKPNVAPYVSASTPGESIYKAKVTSATLTSGIPALVCDIYDADEVTVLHSSESIALPVLLRTRPATTLEIQPAYAANQWIYVTQPIGGTLAAATAGGDTWLDINVDARKWCLSVSFCISGVNTEYWVPCLP